MCTSTSIGGTSTCICSILMKQSVGDELPMSLRLLSLGMKTTKLMIVGRQA
ncbi:hypothetical protein LINPERPRIM_LOCUS29820, partial [Linum perenne]